MEHIPLSSGFITFSFIDPPVVLFTNQKRKMSNSGPPTSFLLTFLAMLISSATRPELKC